MIPLFKSCPRCGKRLRGLRPWLLVPGVRWTCRTCGAQLTYYFRKPSVSAWFTSLAPDQSALAVVFMFLLVALLAPFVHFWHLVHPAIRVIDGHHG